MVFIYFTRKGKRENLFMHVRVYVDEVRLHVCILTELHALITFNTVFYALLILLYPPVVEMSSYMGIRSMSILYDTILHFFCTILNILTTPAQVKGKMWQVLNLFFDISLTFNEIKLKIYIYFDNTTQIYKSKKKREKIKNVYLHTYISFVFYWVFFAVGIVSKSRSIER